MLMALRLMDLIVADKNTEFTSRYGAGEGRDATSPIDGPGNFAKMLTGGDDAATGIQSGLNDANHAGFNDWYLPARMELYALYWGLKPTDVENETDSNTNPGNSWSVPQRDPKTATDPAQTTVEPFRATGAQFFESETTGEGSRYWSSTEAGSLSAHNQRFRRGQTTNISKQDIWKVRAVRRVAVADLVEDPPTEEEAFRATFADASGRDAQVTALVNASDCQRLINHNVSLWAGKPGVWRGQPKWYRVPVKSIKYGELHKAVAGMPIFIRADQPGLREGKRLLIMSTNNERSSVGPAELLCMGWEHDD
jgi:hypothetical protein